MFGVKSVSRVKVTLPKKNDFTAFLVTFERQELSGCDFLQSKAYYIFFPTHRTTFPQNDRIFTFSLRFLEVLTNSNSKTIRMA